MNGTRFAIVAGLACAACQSSGPTTTAGTRSAPASRSCKPEAPLVVELATRSFGDTLELTARATPTSPVDAVELTLALPAHATAIDPIAVRFAATAAGRERVLVARVRADLRASSITAIARVPIDGVDMSRTVTRSIGAPVAEPVARSYALPDGERAREVAP